ncbi:MAG: AhpC/TSA family protein [Bacteroidota bacterium]|nr:AhpC/TSA family protein [Bacteroidota bacterium]
MKNLYSFALLLLISSELGNAQTSNGFEITGIIKNLEDSSWVYLNMDNKITDSSMAIGGKFVLRGKVKEPTECVLYLSNVRDSKFIWIENKLIKIEAEKGKLREAKVSGSSTQAEEDTFRSSIMPLRKQEDNLRLLQRDADKNRVSELNKELEKLEQQEKAATISFIKEHPNWLFSVYVLNIGKTSWGKEQVRGLFNALSGEMRSSTQGKQIKQYLEINVNPKIGDHFVDFELPNPEGKSVKLSQIKGKFVLLDFWAAWCGPCREENKELVKTYAEFHPKGFEILGVSADNNKKEWLYAVKKDGLVWENVSNLKEWDCLPFSIYGINGIPDNFLIDENGKIIARNLRGDDLRKKLKELFNE